MATPKRTWFRGHAGIRDSIRDNDVLAFFWGLHERLRRETFERGREEWEVGESSRFAYLYLMHDTGKGTKPAAIRVARDLEKLSIERWNTPGSGWCFGEIHVEFGATEWTCIWPKWAELQERRPRQEAARSPTSVPLPAPYERRGEQTKPQEKRGDQPPSDSWKQMCAIWDRETRGRHGSLTNWLGPSRKYFERNERKPSDDELVHEAIRRARSDRLGGSGRSGDGTQ